MKYIVYGLLMMIVTSAHGHVIEHDTVTSSDDTFAVKIKKKLVIGVQHIPPFVVIDETDNPSGLSIRLLENIMKNSDYIFEYKIYQNLPDLIDGIANKEVDLSINPITVTVDRLQKLDFSQPFFCNFYCLRKKV